ncbi:hypothetical protein BR93DRAFT_724597 [Coniochaeta sp. PMI_546]|nr:hypothetical protein BR93DRAFT_724597 [Coniochaeta sp. PMI_546]
MHRMMCLHKVIASRDRYTVPIPFHLPRLMGGASWHCVLMNRESVERFRQSVESSDRTADSTSLLLSSHWLSRPSPSALQTARESATLGFPGSRYYPEHFASTRENGPLHQLTGPRNHVPLLNSIKLGITRSLSAVHHRPALRSSPESPSLLSPIL